ncbi:choice-of-anchor tandem repeat GloVer-containing protein [Terrimonas pollutisoli]|uniref:choice-of-anchor tandem repeat GloVer-containing protein n=1 Tax=Terrimonas pollutisoli TaxID=3034147 RepID=UPI0023ED68D2|nr:choice-of-anchor tandem repeat GloVer-containing protein [Terrimonas sp. H1YJ31]
MKRKFYPAFILYLSSFFSATGFGQGIFQIWGMTSQGGVDEIGVIFKTDGKGKHLKPVYNFPVTNEGATAMYNKLTEYNGKFYAMTSQGGKHNTGVIFEWDPLTNIYIKKYDFELANGINPHGSFAVLNNKFYGMTLFGGANDKGVIFEWDPASNIYTKKYDFDGANGSNPYGGLVYEDGKFYGMTHDGGTNDKGVIFEWDPASNIYTKKYDFDEANGSNPYGDLAIKDGKFYGMTYSGGINNFGVFFEWDVNSNIYSKKYDLNSTSGGRPYGSLILVNNRFYGMTSRGGAGHYGVIFEWEPITNAFTKRLEFGDIWGSPRGSLLYHNGKLYGCTSPEFRPKGFFWGHLFEFDLATNVYTEKYVFTRQGPMTEIDNVYDGDKSYSTLVEKNGKLYGMTSVGGASDNGVIFEFDLEAGVYKKKINFNAHENGSAVNSLVFHENHLFGVTENGGFDGLGVIFEWDFATKSFNKKYQFDGITGATSTASNSRYPKGKLTPYNGKLYGATSYSLAPVSFTDHIFGWNFTTNQFEQFQLGGNFGILTRGNLVESGGKLYGTHGYGGGPSIFEYDLALQQTTLLPAPVSSDNELVENDGKLYGVDTRISEWDIANSLFTVKHDFVASTGTNPVGAMLLYKDRYYGMTDAGGANNLGVIFEWDLVSNTYVKKYDFNSDDGGNPVGCLVENNGKMYGMTRNGGSLGLGTIFEWNPVNNNYKKQSEFNGVNGRNPLKKNRLTLVPVSVAAGTPGTCNSYAPVAVDNSNHDDWVPIMDDDGLAVAEIKANGNNLGLVNASVFVNNLAVREDGTKRLYLDRSITIRPQFQPSGPVDVRLYIRGEEFQALKTAVNSSGKGAGINTITDLGIFKNDDGCHSSLQKKATPLVTQGEEWIDDYVLQTSVTSFSTFYFANKSSAALPLNLLEFTAKLEDNDALLHWKTENELNTLEFNIERSIDGTHFNSIGKVAAANIPGSHDYRFTDPGINNSGFNKVYYRLQQKDIEGKFTYSKIVSIVLNNETNYVRLSPNPADNLLHLQVRSATGNRVIWNIINVSGITVMKGQRAISQGNNITAIDVSKLSKGIYLMSVQGDGINTRVQFVKQ